MYGTAFDLQLWFSTPGVSQELLVAVSFLQKVEQVFNPLDYSEF